MIKFEIGFFVCLFVYLLVLRVRRYNVSGESVNALSILNGGIVITGFSGVQSANHIYLQCSFCFT